VTYVLNSVLQQTTDCLTLQFSEFRAVDKEHVCAKCHRAKFSG